jgi:hypothetical protein
MLYFFVVVPLVIGFRKGQEFFPAGKHVDRTTQPRVRLILRDLFPGLKRLGRECDCSLQCIIEVKQACSSTPTAPYAVMVCLFIKYLVNLNFACSL